jgi:hypothetical protein
VVRRCTPDGSALAKNPLLHPTVVMRADCLRRHGIAYRERYRFAEDYFLWLELSQHGRLAALDDVVLRYRLTASATRVLHLKGVLAATLKVKWDAVSRLGLRPTLLDGARFAGECLLIATPTPIVLAAYRHLVLRWQR